MVSGFKCLHNVCNHHCEKNKNHFVVMSIERLTEPSYRTKLLNFDCNKFHVNTYDADALSHCVSWQILAETGTHGTGATVQSCHFAPNCAYSRFEGWLLWNGHACLCFEYVNTSFANVELAMFLLAATFNLK